MHYIKCNTVSGIVKSNLSLNFAIRLYEYFILIMDSHRFGTQNEAFYLFCKFLTIHLNKREIETRKNIPTNTKT